jgi:hypothetical protein
MSRIPLLYFLQFDKNWKNKLALYGRLCVDNSSDQVDRRIRSANFGEESLPPIIPIGYCLRSPSPGKPTGGSSRKGYAKIYPEIGI